MFTLPPENIPANPSVLILAQDSTEVREFTPIAVPVEADPTTDTYTDPSSAVTTTVIPGASLLENLGLTPPTPDPIVTTMEDDCGVDPDTLMHSQEHIGSNDTRAAAASITTSHLSGSTVLAPLSSSATIAITSASALRFTDDKAKLLPVSITYDQSGESTAPPARLLSMQANLNTNKWQSGTYSNTLTIKVKLSQDYVKLMQTLYKNNYSTIESRDALKKVKLSSFADSLDDILRWNSNDYGKQISRVILGIQLKMKNNKTNKNNYSCYGSLFLFVPPKTGESCLMGCYGNDDTPYVQENFLPDTGISSLDCYFSSSDNYSANFMDSIELSDFSVTDFSLSTYFSTSTPASDSSLYGWEKRRIQAMSFEMGKSTSPPPLPPVIDEPGTKTDAELIAKTNLDPKCSVFNDPSASSLRLVYERESIAYFGKKTGMWTKSMANDPSLKINTLTKITPSSFTISNVTPTGFKVNVAAATNISGTPSYRVYYKTSAFSSNSALRLTGEGTLAGTLSAAGSVDISGLSANTTYYVGVVATDTSTAYAVYTPSSQKTSATPTATAITVGAVSATAVSTTGLSLSIVAASGGSGTLTYKIYQKAGAFSAATTTAISSEGTLLSTRTDVSTAITVSSLTANTSYQFAVIVSDTLGSTAVAGPISQATAAPAITVGTLSAGSVGTTSMSLTIAAASGGSGSLTYKVYLKSGTFSAATTTAVAAEGTLISTLTDISSAVSISSLTANTSYQLAVIINDPAGSQALAGPITQATSAPAITVGTLSASAPAFTGFKVTPSVASGGSGTLTYKLYKKTGTFSAATIVAVEAEGTLVTTTTTAGTALSVSSLSGNTSYQLAATVTDALSTKALYTPITQATNAARTIYRIAAPNGNLGGVSGADTLCTTNAPSSLMSAKAMLVNGGRTACTTANCGGGAGEHSDWILNASTAYINRAGATVGTTTSAGIFTFPLSAGMGEGGEWFNGFSGSKDWRGGGSSCLNWTSAVGSDVGNVGFNDVTSSGALAQYNQNCNRTDVYLICVEQ